MPRRSVPKYALHKPTGQARVRLNGKDVYLGKYGSPESHERYTEAIAEWQGALGEPVQQVNIATLTKLYLQWCKTYYRKNGRQTSEVNAVRISLRHLNQKYRNLQAGDFDSLKLKAVRQSMIDAGYVRTSINRHVTRIRAMFKWASAEKLVRESVWLGLKTVDGLKEGRSRAVEAEPVGTVPDTYVDAVRAHVTAPVWAMIEVQRLTGMRPGEVVQLRAIDLNMSGKVWEFRPADHKNRHHKRERVVLIGVKAQDVLRPYLTTDLEAYLFDPYAGRAEFIGRKYRAGSRAGVRNGRRRYSIHGYSCAIKRACDAAGILRWTPNQLRHNFATEARRTAGVEVARVLLGHSSAVTTEIYAERDLDAGRAVVAKIG
jgi:site-specific recombinase XerD